MKKKFDESTVRLLGAEIALALGNCLLYNRFNSRLVNLLAFNLLELMASQLNSGRVATDKPLRNAWLHGKTLTGDIQIDTLSDIQPIVFTLDYFHSNGIIYRDLKVTKI